MLDTTIEYAAPDDLPPDGPALVVSSHEAVPTVADRYRGAGRGPFEAGVPLVAIFRTPALSTPDEVEVVETVRDGDAVQVRVDIRSYTGPLLANVVRVGLVEIWLGSLPPGTYEVRVDARTLPFDDLEAPADAGEPTVSVEEVAFEIEAPQ